MHAHGYVSKDEDAARADFLPAYRRRSTRSGVSAAGRHVRDAVEGLVGPDGALFLGQPEPVADKIVELHQLMGLDRFELHAAHVGHALT